MKSVLSEFAQYGVDFERLDDFMKEVPPESYLHYKLDDIRTIYEKFEEYLSEKYITKEEMLDVLSDAVPYSDILKGSVVAMDGFTGFTPVQNRLIGELFSVCEKVMITVTMDGRENPYVYEHPYQIFALGKQMVTSLMKIAGEKKKQRLKNRYVCLKGRCIVFGIVRKWRFWKRNYSGIQAQNITEAVSLYRCMKCALREKRQSM